MFDDDKNDAGGYEVAIYVDCCVFIDPRIA